MYVSADNADRILSQAQSLARDEGDGLHAALQDSPGAIYITDPDGVVTWFNAACIALTGRDPRVGEDRWCVTWKLFTDDGVFLPHDQCPMAVAIRERRPVRGVTAVAERPDGSRVRFLPYPTPLWDADGAFLGAVNLLVDITDASQVDYFRAQAARCRRLARSINDSQARNSLSLMAGEYEAKVAELDARLARPH
jgi:PAS domain-containing protein